MIIAELGSKLAVRLIDVEEVSFLIVEDLRHIEVCVTTKTKLLFDGRPFIQRNHSAFLFTTF